MAKLSQTPYTGNLDLHDYSEKNMEKIESMLNALCENSAKINLDDPKCDLKGACLKFQVADNYAHYIVVCNKPLTLAHIPVFDAYTIPAAHVRGITREDVLDQLMREKKIRELFSKKG